MRVLLIDDDPFYYKLLEKPMKDAGHEVSYGKSAHEGLALVSAKNPDVVILDLRLPDIGGLDVLERLRTHPQFNHIPVIVITAKNELGDKLKAFELGADDYLIKPFQPEELVARMRILARRGRAIKIIRELEQEDETVSTVIAVHSLRGGSGCSSIAVNLALAFQQIWAKPTLLVDAVFSAGQVAMMLDTKPRFTWSDFTEIGPGALDDEVMNDLIGGHESGIYFIAAPKSPIAVDTYSDEFWRVILEKIKKRFSFTIFDTAHDFTDITIQMLNAATTVLLVVSPEMSSLRAALSTIDIYDRLGFPPEKITLLLNNNISIAGLRQSQIEKVLKRPIDFTLPYEPDEVLRALNFGEPFILGNPDLSLSMQLEDIAYNLSHEIYKNIPPAAPTAAWKRVTNRVGRKTERG